MSGHRRAAAHTASPAHPTKGAGAKLDAQGKIYVRDRNRPALRRGQLRRGRPLRQRPAPSAGRRVVTAVAPSTSRRDRHRQRPDVKAGSWGSRTVEKIVRATEMALARGAARLLGGSSDSAGARITDQSRCSPAAAAPAASSTTRWRSRGKVPQICSSSVRVPRAGPTSPASATSSSWSRQRLDVPRSPRNGRDGRRREGLPRGDGRRPDALHRPPGRRPARARDAEAIELAKHYFVLRPRQLARPTPTYCRRGPTPLALTRETVPERESVPFDIPTSSTGSSTTTPSSKLAQAAVGGRARHRLRPPRGPTVGIVANNSNGQGWRALHRQRRQGRTASSGCAMPSNVPLVYLADVPGFMIGSEVERGGIIRHGPRW